MQEHQKFIQRAMDLAVESAVRGTGPFGCVVVRGGEVVGEGWNQVTELADPTAHAEMQAIRHACTSVGSFELTGMHVYTSSYPCPMCIGALYWARVARVFYVNTVPEAAGIGFDDQFIYEEIALPDGERKVVFEQLDMDDRMQAFDAWDANAQKILY